MCHDEQGHFTLGKTLKKIQDSFWFRGMRKFISKYINSCFKYLYYKSTSGKKPGLVHLIEKKALLFDTLHLDHEGPYVKSKNNNTQILTMVDAFTKFCILEPVRDTKSKWFIRTLQQLITILEYQQE